MVLAPTRSSPEQRASAQHQVRSLLSQSAAFQQLPPDRQAEVLADTDKVVGFIADAGGSEMLAATGAAPVRASARSLAGQPPRRDTAAAADLVRRPPTYLGQAGEDLGNVVKKVDFPGFVADLIKGVFNAVVDASIEQMEAYTELVANVSKSVDQYMKDNVSEDQARDYLTSRYPDHLEADLDAGRVVPKRDADEDNAPDFLMDLGIPFDFGDLGDQDTEKELVTAARRRMSMDRQQMLATMVMMGLNRIVVTDGSIQAGVRFDLNAETLAKLHYDQQTSFDYHHERRSKTKRGGWFTKPRTTTTKSTLDISTDSNLESDNENSQALKVKMTGNVDLRFKSDYFPLERMTEIMGINQDQVSSAANQGVPAAPAAPPPNVPIPALPGQ